MNRCSCNHWLPSSKELSNLSQMAKIFSSKSKLKILIILLARKHCVCEIQTCLDKEQSLVSHHLSDLVKTGWIKQRKGKDARKIHYFLTKKGKQKLEIFLQFRRC